MLGTFPVLSKKGKVLVEAWLISDFSAAVIQYHNQRQLKGEWVYCGVRIQRDESIIARDIASYGRD